ncbi:MAG: hypothetical protein VW297_11440 [Paracoccaceae bacterium]
MIKPDIHALDDEARELSFAEQGYLFDLGGRQKLPSYIRDHRQRLRERFLKGGPDAMPDYELLELILLAKTANSLQRPPSTMLAPSL